MTRFTQITQIPRTWATDRPTPGTDQKDQTHGTI